MLLRNNKILIAVPLLMMGLLTACSEDKASFSILSASEDFSQSVTSFNNKIDIIWVVDSSGSMAPYQNNLANNFNAFITDFTAKGYDYHMVVASTDAWVREYNYNGGTCSSNPNPSHNPNTIYESSADCNNTVATFGQLTWFRDGNIYDAGASNHSGKFLLDSTMNMTDVINYFTKNIKVGIRGDGSERGMQSLRSVLRRNENGSPAYGGESHTVLSTFRRNDAFLAVIFVGDEEDQSRKADNTSYSSTTAYKDAALAFLDGYTGGSADNRKYNVSSIVVQDLATCAGHDSSASKGTRFMALSAATNGVTGSICDSNFSASLENISTRIVELSTRFELSREPIPSTIQVMVDGISVPENATNGWTYLVVGTHYYVAFHGPAVPPQGASISIRFDPAHLDI